MTINPEAMRLSEDAERGAAAGCASSNLDVHVARTISEVEAVREIWSGWRTHRDSDIDFCLGYVWARKEFIRPHVIVLYREGRPDAMLLGRVEHSRMDSKIGHLRIPGGTIRLLCFSYQGFLGNQSVENSEVFVRLIMAALKQGQADVASLHYPVVGSPIHERALSVPAFALRDHRSKPVVHNVMELADNIEQVFRGLSSGLRAELRRKKKKIEAEFQSSVKIQCFHDQTDLDDVMPRVEEIAKKTYQRGLGVGFQDSPEMRRRLQLCAEKGWLRIYLLSLADKPCAFWIGTVYEGEFCSDYLAHDPEFSDYSPGSYLLTAMIEDFCKGRVKSIDFGFGGGRYKERFGNQQRVESSVSFFAPTPKGISLNVVRTMAGLADDAARKVLERMTLLPALKKRWRARLTRQALSDQTRQTSEKSD